MGYLNETGLARFYAGLKTKFAGKSAANLLDNWYFGNPVNQRGQTSYTGTGTRYTIDRWRAMGGVRVDVASTGLTIKGSSAAASSYMANQPLPSELCDALHGKTATVSMLVGQNTEGSQVSVRIGSATGTACAAGLSTLTLVFDKTAHTSVGIHCNNNTACDFTVLAMKLELGDTQTLARQENGAWVLNEISDYGEQLARCQRYLLKLEYATRYRMCEIRSHSLAFFIPTPVTMREKPALHIGNGSIDVRNPNSAYIAGFTVYAESLAQNGVMIHASKTNHGVSDAVLVSAGHDNYLIAEL